ncbi:MAG: SF1B family DNA helicase RecD2 [Opitutales bacterium]
MIEAMANRASRRPAGETLTGVLERVLFFNEENQFCIGELRAESLKRTVVVTGPLPGVQCGETLEVSGQWTHHPKHGEQFKVERFASRLPATVYGIRKYLGSGLVPGIGPKYADKIVDHFGTETLDIISHHSRRLQEVPGIGKGRAEAIKKAWDAQHAVRQVMLFLQTYGVTSAQCVRLVKKYGDNAERIVRENPYQLVRDIERIGFKTADRIALNLGFSNAHPQRSRAGLLHALNTLEEEGHTIGQHHALIDEAVHLLELEKDLVLKQLEALIENGDLLPVPTNPPAVQSPALARAERTVAQAVRTLLAEPAHLPSIHIEKAVAWAQDRAGFAFAPEQADAVRAAIGSKLSIITGGPGTGKTTILQAVVAILQAKKVKLLLASPTGRAAQRLAETTGATASTIHRILKYDPAQGGFFHNADRPLPADVLILDEVSMLDTRLAALLLQAVKPATQLILVGDADQLPSVGPGNLLQDLIASGLPTVIRLATIFRQREGSQIVDTAHGILAGKTSLARVIDSAADIRTDDDFHFIRADEPEVALERTRGLVARFIHKAYQLNPVMDIQVLAPMHKGIAGIQNLNTSLQADLNGPDQAKQRPARPLLTPQQQHFRQRTGKPLPTEITYGGTVFRIGDKVIQTRNNYDKGLFNGDMGQVVGVSPDGSQLTLSFEGDQKVFERGELGDLQLAYTLSVHKSQGSEYPVVVIVLLRQHYMMLQRNLLYTALTRGRKKVFIVGDPQAWEIAIRNRDAQRRLTDLKRKLKTSE